MTEPVRYLGFFIPEGSKIWDALIDLHEIGRERGDSDEQIAAACFAMLKANGAERQKVIAQCKDWLEHDGNTLH